MPKIQCFCVDSTLSQHLNHHECNNIGTCKRGRCLFIMSNPERCTDLFVVMFKLDIRWVGQNQSELCSNLEIGTEKWTGPIENIRLTLGCPLPAAKWIVVAPSKSRSFGLILCSKTCNAQTCYSIFSPLFTLKR